MTVGVILLTFGTATSTDDVPRYLLAVRGGRAVPPDLVAEFQRRFEQVGGSPLIEITRRQAEALEGQLNHGAGETGQAAYVVTIGMRHSAPTISDGLRALSEAGAERLVGIIMSPQFSGRILGGYLEAFADAQREVGPAVPSRVAHAWHHAPPFTEALAYRVQEALQQLPEDLRSTVPVVFTAHSLPRTVAEAEPEYLDQLHETAEAVLARASLPAERAWFAYQSAGHTPEEWLKPDLSDLVPQLRATGHRAVLVAPVQFLADHLEVLYDIDVAAAEQAARVGLQLHRVESLNTLPKFIDALAWVVHRELKLLSS